MDKQKRVEIVNEIIIEIASRGRKFFHSDGNIAELFLRNGKIFYKFEWACRGVTETCLSIPDYRKPKGWQHGGTLLGLVRDFCDFIKGDDDANHNNGYGGLYCPHWGYSEEDMNAIQAKAIELGYLKPKTNV
ncbi:hypothetical protein [Pedobacter panaciterrae]